MSSLARKSIVLIAVGVLAIAAAIALLPRIGVHFDNRAVREASAFCQSIAVGSTEAAVRSVAAAHRVSLSAMPLRNGVVRYQAWFSGFLANGASCEIAVTAGSVTGAFLEKHTW